MRRIFVVLAACLVAAPIAEAETTRGRDRAYTLSLMCSVVASYYRNDADIQRTAVAMRKMGAAMGYDNARIAKDATTMASVLGNELRTDPASMERHRASCRQIGLAS